MPPKISDETLTQVILDQQEEYQAHLHAPNVWTRQSLKDLIPALKRKPIKVITGIRRSGKSTLALQGMRTTPFLALNFDDERLVGLTTQDLARIERILLQINPNKPVYFFDEIQNISNWELFVSRLHRKGQNIIITGSNSKLLSQELATHLTGRYIPIEMFPFSFLEFCKSRFHLPLMTNNLSTSQIAQLIRLFGDYFKMGGFPEVLYEGAQPADLRELYDKIVTRDIVTRFKVNHPTLLKELARYCITNPGTLLSINKMQKVFGINSIHTAKKYIDYLQEAYLIKLIPLFSNKISQQINQPKKLYSIDHGLTRAMSTKFLVEEAFLLENIVFLELWRRKKEIFHYTSASYGIDFVIREEQRVNELIQVCHSFKKPETIEREVRALEQASKDLRCSALTLITFTEETWPSYLNSSKIKLIPIWKWLLS